MAKKKNKALKSLEKDVAKLRKRNDKLAKAIEKTQEDQAAAYKELRNLLEERLPAQDSGSADEHKGDSRDGDEKPEATEAAARTAENLGINLSSARGTGARGRILVKDVEAAADTKQSQ
jgi:pyruvate/2-oxoglutarate dehydrogenase complex dihydrolipoamide acyltransferase (E2) component